MNWQPIETAPHDKGEFGEVKTHRLKTWPSYFDAVYQGVKTFEIRKDDRGFDLGDILILQEWDEIRHLYTGRELLAKVTYITNFGQQEGQVVMAIERLPGRDFSSVVVVDREVMPPWTQEEPKESGSYWMWDGSDESLPAHVEVFWSGTDNRCFVPSGQYGWTRHQDMDELKGYWWCKLVCPSLPGSAALASLNAGGEG